MNIDVLPRTTGRWCDQQCTKNRSAQTLQPIFMSFEAGYSNFLSIPSPYLSIPKIVSFYLFLYRSIFICLHLHQSTSICCMSIYIPLSYLHLSVTLSFYPLVYSNDAYALFVSQSFWTDQSVSKVHQLLTIHRTPFISGCLYPRWFASCSNLSVVQ